MGFSKKENKSLKSLMIIWASKSRKQNLLISKRKKKCYKKVSLIFLSKMKPINQKLSKSTYFKHLEILR